MAAAGALDGVAASLSLHDEVAGAAAGACCAGAELAAGAPPPPAFAAAASLFLRIISAKPPPVVLEDRWNVVGGSGITQLKKIKSDR